MAQFNAFDISFQEDAFQREWYVEPDSFVQEPGDCVRSLWEEGEARVILVIDEFVSRRADE